MKHGDVIMSMNGKLLPKLICYFTGAERSHAGIVIEVHGDLYFYDAAAKGVAPQPLSVYLSRPKDIAVLRPKEIPINLFQKVKKYNGRPYGFGDLIIHHFLRQLLLKFGIKSRWTGRGATTGDRSIVCTELVALVYNRPKWWRYTPKDLENDTFFELIEERKI